MAAEWYYTTYGQQLGPVSERELRRQAAEGGLQPGDLVWKEGMPRWVAAHTVKEFDLRRPLRNATADLFLAGDWSGPPRRLSAKARVATGLGVSVGLLVVVGVVIVLVGFGPRRTPGGATDGPGDWEHRLGPNTLVRWEIEFRGDGPAQVWIEGRNNTQVHLLVYERHNLNLGPVAMQTDGISDRRSVTWYPPGTRFYMIQLENRDPLRSNVVRIRHN